MLTRQHPSLLLINMNPGGLTTVNYCKSDNYILCVERAETNPDNIIKYHELSKIFLLHRGQAQRLRSTVLVFIIVSYSYFPL